jgi:hypothetical protein
VDGLLLSVKSFLGGVFAAMQQLVALMSYRVSLLINEVWMHTSQVSLQSNSIFCLIHFNNTK